MNHYADNINTDEAKYAARCWRTTVLREEAAKQITKMLQAFVPEGYIVRITEEDHAVPGFPHCPNFQFRGVLRDSRIDGSDAHIMVSGYTREGVQTRLLAAILEEQGFFPLT